MKRSKDPFEAAIEEESPPESPLEIEVVTEANNKDENEEKEEDEEDENMKIELTKYTTGADPVNKANKMQAILAQFTEDQVSRYEYFRRSSLKKSSMEKLFKRITGAQTMGDNTNMVVRGIAKMFVGELVETARVVMRERKESGPIRPCHIRESYRRLKLQGKVPQRSVPRLFH